MGKWIPSWQYVPIDYNQEIGVFENITQESIFTNNLSGEAIRVRLNNLYSNEPMSIRYAAIALRNRITGKLSQRMALTLNGEENLVIPANTAVYSDEIVHPVSWQEDFVLWLYFKERTVIRSVCTTSTWCSWQSIQQTGNFHETDVLGFTVKPQLAPVLAMDPYPNQFAAGVCEISVYTQEDSKLVALFGDSITHMSYFSDCLTALLYERFPGKCAVINGGISGNRIQKNNPSPKGFPGEGHQFGIAGKERFLSDLYSGGAPDYVFILEGVNDCSHSIVFEEPKVPTAQDIFAALEEVIHQGQQLGSKVFVSTITPFGAFGEAWREQAEDIRCACNELIRQRNTADGWIDLDALLRDPDNPHRMQCGMNLGDGVHPNWMGGTKMAKAVANQLFQSL